MAGLPNNVYLMFLVCLIILIVGIYLKYTFLFFVSSWFIAALMGWVARGDDNGRHKNGH